MYDRRAAHERADEPDHEIYRMVGWQDAQVAHARPEGVERRERDALFQIVFVRQHAAFRTASGARRIDDAGPVRSFAWNEVRFAFDFRVFPSNRATQVDFLRGAGDDHSPDMAQYRKRQRPFACGAGRCRSLYCARFQLRDRAPQVVFGDEDLALRVREQGHVLRRAQFVIEWYEDAARVKYRISRDRPAGLVGHDDRRSRSGFETAILQEFRHRRRGLFEFAVVEPVIFALAVGFDQTGFAGEFIDRLAQGRAERLMPGQVNHFRVSLESFLRGCE